MKHNHKCPFCGSDNVDAEYVDIDVGMEQVTPFNCYDCGAQQMHPFHDDKSKGDAEEQRVGWWKGFGSPSSN